MNTSDDEERIQKDHERFMKHLEASQDAVWRAGRWLSGKKYDVAIPATTVGPEYKGWEKHVDKGDLYIAKDNVQQRIEVKKLSVNFTCRDDWPFKDKFIVCAKHSFDNASPKPHAYIIMSDDMQYVATVKGESCSQWEVETKVDTRYDQISQRFYMSPLDLVRFIKM